MINLGTFRRSTGRTTRMCQDIIRALAASDVVVFCTGRHSEYIMPHIIGLARNAFKAVDVWKDRLAVDGHELLFAHPSEMDPVTGHAIGIRFAGRHDRPVTFIDHHEVEDLCPWALAQWLNYSLPELE